MNKNNFSWGIMLLTVLFVLAPASLGKINDGLQAYYGMENYTDYMGNYPEFVLTGGAVQVNDSHCIIDGCVDFDGTSLLDFTTEVTNFTEMTINMFLHWHDATRDWSYMKTDYSGSLSMITIEQYSDPGNIEFRYYDTNAWQFDAGYYTIFTANEAEEQDMFTITQTDAGGYYAINVYYEGLKVGSANISTGNPLNNGWDDAFGVSSTGGISNRGFNGDADEFAVFNRELTAAEIYRVWQIYEEGQTLFNYSDPDPPICTGFQNITLSKNITYNWSLTCTDDFLYSFYVSCNNTNPYTFNETGINHDNYNFTESVVFNSTALCEYTYCDGHTDDTLKDEFKAEQKTTKKLEITPDGINTAVLELVDNENYELTAERKKDRITFTIENKDITKEKKPKKYTLEYSTPDGEYIDSLLYDGWIIDKKLKTWFDMETLAEASFTMTKVKENTFQFEIESEEDIITFNSIGALNCVNATTLFTIQGNATVPDNDTGDDVISAVGDTGFTATFKGISLLVIWLVLLIYMHGLRRVNADVPQLLNVVALVIGITAGMYWLFVAPIMGMVLVFGACVGFFYLTRRE